MKIREPETLAEAWGDTGGDWRKPPTGGVAERDPRQEALLREKLSRCNRKSFNKVTLPKLNCLER